MDVLYKTIITKVGYSHCARGSVICPKCKEEDARPRDFALIKLFSYSEAARPGMKFEERWYSYDVVQRFNDEREARSYSLSKNISIY